MNTAPKKKTNIIFFSLILIATSAAHGMRPSKLLMRAIKTVTPPQKINKILPMANNRHSLHKAAENGTNHTIRRLLKSGVPVDLPDHNLATPLTIATQNAQLLSTIKLLLKNNANVNAKNIHEETPLIKSAYQKNIAIPSLLLKYGADINASNTMGETALMIAAQQGNNFTASLLIIRGANPQAVDIYTESALTRAIRNNSVDLVKELLQGGSDRYQKNIWGENAFDIAIELDHVQIMNLLFNYSPKPIK
ncbi:MAG: ankyrin repeat domain-containing protein [Candidatus Dependentiae bacterium]|nr:ankyrin repeat domain-containing protein [Candidatus Dependentiae bacterium]